MSCAAAFLNALFDAPREHWFPALVVVDEAQMFAPSASGEVTDAVRRASLAAMTNLMCRGRKRGLAGALATQRLAQLAQNVAAEARGRKSVVEGKSVSVRVDRGGRRIIHNKTIGTYTTPKLKHNKS